MRRFLVLTAAAAAMLAAPAAAQNLCQPMSGGSTLAGFAISLCNRMNAGLPSGNHIRVTGFTLRGNDNAGGGGCVSRSYALDDYVEGEAEPAGEAWAWESGATAPDGCEPLIGAGVSPYNPPIAPPFETSGVLQQVMDSITKLEGWHEVDPVELVVNADYYFGDPEPLAFIVSVLRAEGADPASLHAYRFLDPGPLSDALAGAPAAPAPTTGGDGEFTTPPGQAGWTTYRVLTGETTTGEDRKIKVRYRYDAGGGSWEIANYTQFCVPGANYVAAAQAHWMSETHHAPEGNPDMCTCPSLDDYSGRCD